MFVGLVILAVHIFVNELVANKIAFLILVAVSAEVAPITNVFSVGVSEDRIAFSECVVAPMVKLSRWPEVITFEVTVILPAACVWAIGFCTFVVSGSRWRQRRVKEIE